MRKYLASSVIALCIAGFGSPAKADVVYVMVSGTVTGGDDASGLFGTAGGSLIGDGFTAQYEFNTSLGTTLNSTTENYAYGGSEYNTTSPSLGASLTINGRTVLIAGDYFGESYAASQSRTNADYTTTVENPSSILESNIIGPSGSTPSINTPFNIDGGGGVNFDDNNEDFLTMAPTVYNESLMAPVSAVPEPASTVLFGIGLLATGIVVRRRK
jgi:hypothetical protein